MEKNRGVLERDQLIIDSLRSYKDRVKATNEELAQAIGVSKMTVHRWFNEKHSLRILSRRSILHIIQENRCPMCGRRANEKNI